MHQITSKINAITGSFRRLGRQPVFDWYFLISGFFLALAVIALVCVIGYLRLGYAEVAIPTAEIETGSVLNFSVDSIGKTLESVAERRQNAGTVPSSVLVDPS
jgi:hypothetical protein